MVRMPSLSLPQTVIEGSWWKPEILDRLVMGWLLAPILSIFSGRFFSMKSQLSNTVGTTFFGILVFQDLVIR